ncbi:hypothetical protein B0H34DRAFT_158271 [Crassisporium funariophilum]|nr:hypothetical protein B0H34DRAFT_158271 [Crassisporium funariophilum]
MFKLLDPSASALPSMRSLNLAFFLSLLPVIIFAKPAVGANELGARQKPDNIVIVNDANNFCMIMPRYAHTNIGDSEYTGGMKTYCSPAAHSSPDQGQLPPDFWSNVEFRSGISSRNARYAQLTGCIRPETLDRLNTNDGGGQYDSSGGAGGAGNPAGSKCSGCVLCILSEFEKNFIMIAFLLSYKHYVELVEPGDKRACIKCCDNYDDCPLHLDTSGCPKVIKGNYFNCS